MMCSTFVEVCGKFVIFFANGYIASPLHVHDSRNVVKTRMRKVAKELTIEIWSI